MGLPFIRPSLLCAHFPVTHMQYTPQTRGSALFSIGDDGTHDEGKRWTGVRHGSQARRGVMFYFWLCVDFALWEGRNMKQLGLTLGVGAIKRYGFRE